MLRNKELHGTKRTTQNKILSKCLTTRRGPLSTKFLITTNECGQENPN